MRALVTGGAGFLGSHVVEALARGGNRVTVVDDLSRGLRENLPGLPAALRLRRVGDLRPADLRDVTHVFHLAAQVSVPRSLEHPAGDLRGNAADTLHLLELCRRARVERFVYASTSAIYGRAGSVPLREGDPPAPLSPYGVSKWAGEAYCRLYHRLYGLSTVSLRIFNAYGPRQPATDSEGAVVARFLRARMRGRPVEIHGTGRQTRDFIYAEDVAGAFLRAAAARGVAGESFNIATGRETSIRDLARLLFPGAETRTLLGRPGDVPRSVADVGAARKRLRFRARTSLEEGLARTLASQGLPVDPRGRRARSW